MTEIWKDVKDYEGLYQVSNLGRIKSLGNNKTRKEKILKGGKDKDSYLNVILCKEGIRKNYKVHRLVASAFLDNSNNLPEVNHINEIKTDNRVENLEWCTAKYNNNFGTRIERISKPILQFTKEGKFVKKWDSAKDIQKELGIYKSNITACCKGKYKSAGGFIWMYAKIGVFEIDINKLKKVA